MIWELIVYMLKVNLAVLACYLAYTIFMRGSVSHQWNRWFLLLVPALAIVMPLLSAPTTAIELINIQLPEVQLIQGVINEAYEDSNWMMSALSIWVLGILFMLIKTSKELQTVFKESKNYKGECSFTFFRSIRVNQSLPYEIKQKVLVHEQVHADQWHSLDLIWIELFRIVFWFNPVFSLMQKSLKELHEFIADAVTNKQTKDYSETLIAFAFGLNKLPLANQFQSVNIKNRIKMIHKTNSLKHKAGLVFSMAIAVVAIISISWTSVSDSLSTNANQKVLKEVDTMPRFNGCESKIDSKEAAKCSNEKLMNYMISSVNYPKKAQSEDIEGKVFVEFTVDASGNVKDAKVKKGVHELLDAEALRVVNNMPQWTAGVHQGKSVAVSMTLPINFALD